ncbi:MAG: glycosyltransferase [Candidatus Hermodarchaeota archaeon]
MIRVLIVSVRYGKDSTGGAATSFVNIINSLKTDQNLKIKIFSRSTANLIKKFLDPLGIGYYLYFFKIYSAIKSFKPDIIITQSRIAFSAICSAKLAKIPIIALIRDTSDLCPKHIDIIKYGTACKGLESRNICYKCIDFWRSLRVLIKNKPQGWQHTIFAITSNIIYKLRFFSIKLNLKLLNKADRVIVASELMRTILNNNIDKNKVEMLNITPIKKSLSMDTIRKNQLLFVIPSFEASHKGLDFISRLSKSILIDYKILIVGGKVPLAELSISSSKIINYNHVSKNELNSIYQQSKITLVPTFCTEAFGRIIIESISNYTPVITSPNCGANYFFKNKDYYAVVPLKISLWSSKINEFIENPPKITISDINSIYEQFSLSKSKRDFSDLIKSMINS